MLVVWNRKKSHERKKISPLLNRPYSSDLDSAPQRSPRARPRVGETASSICLATIEILGHKGLGVSGALLVGLRMRTFPRKVATATRLLAHGELETFWSLLVRNVAAVTGASGLAIDTRNLPPAQPVPSGRARAKAGGDTATDGRSAPALARGAAASASQGGREGARPIVETFPGILIATLPKTGTVFLQNSLCRGLGRPQLDVPSGGLFPYANIPHEAINRLKQQGAIFVMHCAPNRWNIVEIKERLDRVVIHLRDPRQALISWTYYVVDLITKLDPVQGKHFGIPDDYLNWDFPKQLDWQIENYYPYQIEWIQGWVNAAEEVSQKTKILFTTQEELATDQNAFFNRILDFYEIPRAAFTYPSIPRQQDMNFRAGQVSEWKEKMSRPQIESVTRAIPTPLFERFGWPGSEALNARRIRD